MELEAALVVVLAAVDDLERKPRRIGSDCRSCMWRSEVLSSLLPGPFGRRLLRCRTAANSRRRHATRIRSLDARRRTTGQLPIHWLLFIAPRP